MCGRGRAGVRQERTAQYGGRMFVFATTQGFQGDMPSAMRLGLRENSESIDAPWIKPHCEKQPPSNLIRPEPCERHRREMVRRGYGP